MSGQQEKTQLHLAPKAQGGPGRSGGVGRARVIAVTSGKGGVGKTSISVNLAIALAKSGHRVCVLDADTGLANINILLGLHPKWTLEHVLSGERALDEVMLQGPAGIGVIPAASGIAHCVGLGARQRKAMLDTLEALEPRFDYILIDTAAGISSDVMHFVCAAHYALLVITPEPTSLTDAFSLLKVLRHQGRAENVLTVVNMVPGAVKSRSVFERFSGAVRKYLKLEVTLLGAIWLDESIRSAVSLQRPVALFPPSDPSSKSFYRLADQLSEYLDSHQPTQRFSDYWRNLIQQQPAADTPDQEDPALTLEQRWVQLRQQTQSLARHGSTSPDQLLNFVGHCIDLLGDKQPELKQELVNSLLPERGRHGADQPPAPSEGGLQLQSPELAASGDAALEQPAVDPDMLAVFIEEMEEQTRRVRQSLKLMGAYAYSTPFVEDMRRAFHMMKGSSRMIGAVALAELNRLLEQLVKQVIEQRLDMDQRTQQLLVEAMELMPLVLDNFVRQRPPPSSYLTLLHKVLILANGFHWHEADDLAVAQPSLNSLAATDAEDADQPRYDEAGFGDQDSLVARIRQAEPGDNLVALLESIRLASMVDDR